MPRRVSIEISGIWKCTVQYYLTFGTVGACVARVTKTAALAGVVGAAGGTRGQTSGEGRLAVLAPRALPPLTADAGAGHADSLAGAAGIRTVHWNRKHTALRPSKQADDR